MCDPISGCVICGDILTGRRKKYCSSKCQKAKGRSEHLWRCFGITSDEYDTILKYQGGGCAICGRPPKPGKSLAVDHAHTNGRSGRVRGLLCFICNRRLLGARSDATVIRMAEYVSDPPAIQALGHEVIAPGRPRRKRAPRKRKR